MVGTKRRIAHLSLLVFAGVSLCSATGCGKKEKYLSEIRREYAAGNYAETTALCEQALRDNIGTGEVHRYYGLSLLASRREIEGVEHLEKAVEADSTLAGPISKELLSRARENIARGSFDRAARFAKEAVDFAPDADIGSLRYLVAAAHMQDRDWEAATREYARAIAEFPDTTAAERGYFNMAECYVVAGDSGAAISALEKQLKEFPRGPLVSEAHWNLLDILYHRGLTEFSRGEYDSAAVLARRILAQSDDAAVVQRARFLLGESCERAGDFEAAFEQYSAIIKESNGAIGGVVDRAREKIRAFRDAGLPRK